jgi:hypothetical protein
MAVAEMFSQALNKVQPTKGLAIWQKSIMLKVEYLLGGKKFFQSPIVSEATL